MGPATAAVRDRLFSDCPAGENGGSLVLGGLEAIIERVEREGSSFFAQIAGGAAALGRRVCRFDASRSAPPWAYYTIRAE